MKPPILIFLLLAIVIAFIGARELLAIPSQVPEVSQGVASDSSALGVATSSPVTASIGLLTSSPSALYSGISNTITFTAEIDAANIIPGSVILQQLDSDGNVLAGVSSMSANPTKAIFYSVTLPLSPTLNAPVMYRASFATKGSLTRSVTPMLSIPVTSLSTSTWTLYTSPAGFSFQYPSNWILNAAPDGTDVTIDPNNPSQTASIGETLPELHIEYIQNPTNLPAGQFFNGDIGPDLYTNTDQITMTSVGGKSALDFLNPGASDYSTVLVVSLNTAFLMIQNNAPSAISQPLFSTLNIK